MEDELHVRLAPTTPGDAGLKIYVNADSASALKSNFRDAGFTTSDILEHAFGVEDAIISVAAVTGTIGGLQGVAAVLNAFFHKNQHKSLTLRSGDDEVIITGMSKSHMQEVLDRHLESVAKQQKELDESWARILEETTGLGTDEGSDEEG